MRLMAGRLHEKTINTTPNNIGALEELMSINFWITNVGRAWRIEWPHKFLCPDHEEPDNEENIWRKK
jgi:hypothetical protein